MTSSTYHYDVINISTMTSLTYHYLYYDVTIPPLLCHHYPNYLPFYHGTTLYYTTITSTTHPFMTSLQPLLSHHYSNHSPFYHVTTPSTMPPLPQPLTLLSRHYTLYYATITPTTHPFITIPSTDEVMLPKEPIPFTPGTVTGTAGLHRFVRY